jgi:glycosyltransferase involved in cell wall biosynthesis
MVTTFYPPYSFGGDAVYIYRLANELAARGHQVDVIHDMDAFRLLHRDEVKEKYPNHNNVTVHALKSRAGLLSPFLSQQTGASMLKGKKIRKILEENTYDVIHFHNMSLIGLTALKYGRGIKLYTTHEHWLVCPMHVLWKYDREVCTSQNCISCQLQGKRPPQWWRFTSLMDNMFRNVDMFISPSQFTLQKHQEMGLRSPMVHIPYFLPESIAEGSFDREPPHVRPYFLFVGRLEKIKGVQNLIPVFRKHPQYELLIAGEGTYADILQEQANGAVNIRFLGKLSHATLRTYYKHAVAVIVPSICYEVFGIIIIEAFSMKTPVIVNNLGALPEVVEDSGGGIIYNNDSELIEAMDQLSKNTDVRNELGRKGYEAFLRYWNEESHMRKYLGLIEELKEKRITKGVAV